MRNYILASHGPMAKAMIESLELIIGKQNNLYAVCAYTDIKEPIHDLEKLINDLKKEGEIFIFSDILGGSVNNSLMKMLDENIYLFTGMNLPLVLNALMAKKEEVNTLIPRLKKEGKDSIIYCNEWIEERYQEDDF